MKQTIAKFNDNTFYAAKMFKLQLAEARDYIQKERELGFFPERENNQQLPNEEAFNLMKQHKFVRWLQEPEQIGFVEAKKKIVSYQLRVIKSTEIEIISRYRDSFALERLCALAIHLFTDSKTKLGQAVVTAENKKPIVNTMKRLKHFLNQGGGFYFHHEAKQHLLQILLDDLLNGLGDNVLSSKRNHPSLLRQIFTTNFVTGLFRTYENISVAQATEIILDVMGVFFTESQDKRDTERMVHEVSQRVYPIFRSKFSITHN